MRSAQVYYLHTPMVPADKTPNRIRHVRKAKGMTIQQVADEIGMSKAFLSAIERGERQLTISRQRDIARALGCSPADLLSQSDNPDALGDEERRFMSVYRSLPAPARNAVRSLAEQMREWGAPPLEEEENHRRA